MPRPLLFLLLLSLTGCTDFFERDITPTDQAFDPQLVLFALFDPQDSVQVVDLRRTVAAYGGGGGAPNDYRPRRVLAGADVRLLDAGRATPFSYAGLSSLREGYYAATAGLGLLPGGAYTLVATDGELSAGADLEMIADTIPRAEIELGVDAVREDGFTEYLIEATVPNAPGAGDAYLLIHERIDPDGRRASRELFDLLEGRPALGPRLTFRPIRLPGGGRHRLRLCRTTVATYDYLNARETALGNAENPFAEPTQLPDNVTGQGIGHVGSMNCQVYGFAL